MDAYLSPILERYLAGVSGALGSGLPARHDQRRRAGAGGGLPRQGRPPLRTRRRGRRRGARRPAVRLPARDRLRHGGHQHRRRPLGRRLRIPLRASGGGRPPGGARPRHRERGGRRRLDLRLRRHSAQGGAGERRRLARPRLLRRGRTADADRRQPDPRPARSRPLRDPPGRGGGGPRSRPAPRSGWERSIPVPRRCSPVCSRSPTSAWPRRSARSRCAGGTIRPATRSSPSAAPGPSTPAPWPSCWGSTSVLVPADAGLLSALGLGAAVVERFAQRQVLEPLATGEGERLAGWLDELGREAAAAVAAEGIAAGRHRGPAPAAEPPLRRPGGDARRRIRRRCRDRARLRRRLPGDLRLRARGEGDRAGVDPRRRLLPLPRTRTPGFPIRSRPRAVPTGVRRCWVGGAWRDVPVFDRAGLRPGAAFAGPALVFESHSATLVADGLAGAGGRRGEPGAARVRVE